MSGDAATTAAAGIRRKPIMEEALISVTNTNPRIHVMTRSPLLLLLSALPLSPLVLPLLSSRLSLLPGDREEGGG